MEYYLDMSVIFKNYDSVIDELECWLNEKIDFLVLWESIYNKSLVEISKEEVYTLDSWISIGTISISKKDEKYYINPHILLAFIIDEPLYRLNLIASIYTLPSEHIAKILEDVLI
jgi:hypothetical protein